MQIESDQIRTGYSTQTQLSSAYIALISQPLNTPYTWMAKLLSVYRDVYSASVPRPNGHQRQHIFGRDSQILAGSLL